MVAVSGERQPRPPAVPREAVNEMLSKINGG